MARRAVALAGRARSLLLTAKPPHGAGHKARRAGALAGCARIFCVAGLRHAIGKPMERPRNFRSLLALAAVVLLHLGAIALLLIPGSMPSPVIETAMITVNIPNPPPPEPPAPLPGPPEPAAEAAPPAPRARPKPVVAPPPVVKPAEPSIAAPAPSTGTETQSGAGAAGSGTGASGSGLGTGAGGTGRGGGGARAQKISGEISRADYPPDARGAQGSVSVHLDISANGLVTGCRVVGSSGNASLDSQTCRLIRKRFRYRPARDASGTAIPALVGWRQDWWLEPRR